MGITTRNGKVCQKDFQKHIPDNDVEDNIARDNTVPRNILSKLGQTILSFRYWARITHI